MSVGMPKITITGLKVAPKAGIMPACYLILNAWNSGMMGGMAGMHPGGGNLAHCMCRVARGITP